MRELPQDAESIISIKALITTHKANCESPTGKFKASDTALVVQSSLDCYTRSIPLSHC